MGYGPVSPIFWLTHESRPAHLSSFYSLIFLPLFRVLVSWWSLFRPSLILPFLNVSGITVHLGFASCCCHCSSLRAQRTFRAQRRGLDSDFRLLKIRLYLTQLCRLHNLGNLQKNIGPLVFKELTLKRTFQALSSSPIAQSLVRSVRVSRCFLRNRPYRTPLELLSGCR